MILCITSTDTRLVASCQKSSKRLLVVGLMLSVAPLFCYADVYKCTDARGRIVIGDQPCFIKDTPASSKISIKESTRTVISKETIKDEKEQASILLELLEQKILTKHNAECREMRVYLKKHGHFSISALLPSLLTNKNDKQIWEQYSAACIAQANDVVILVQAQKESAAIEKARKAVCDIKAKDYERRKLLLNSSSSDLEVTAFNILQSEVLRGCR